MGILFWECLHSRDLVYTNGLWEKKPIHYIIYLSGLWTPNDMWSILWDQILLKPFPFMFCSFFLLQSLKYFVQNVFLCLHVLIFNLNIHLMYVVYWFHKWHVSSFIASNNSCKLIPCLAIRCSKHTRIVWPNLCCVVGLGQRKGEEEVVGVVGCSWDAWIVSCLSLFGAYYCSLNFSHG
jgi:hypothetical protein